MSYRGSSTRHGVVLVAAAMAVGLSGCASGGSSPSATATTATGTGGDALELSGEPVTLTFQWWGGAERADRTNAAVDKFEEENPNITVETQYADYSPYQEKLATQSAGGQSPDVFQMDLPYVSTYASGGALLDLTTLAPILDLTDFEAADLETGQVDGKLYALLNGVNAAVVLVNPSLLEKAGVPMPDDETWSWEDLQEASAAVSEAGGGDFVGLQDWGFCEDALYYWQRDHGSAVYDSAGDVVADVSAVTAFFQYALDLQSSGATAPASVVSESMAAGQDAQMMSTNRAAFAFGYTNALSAMSSASGSNLELLRLPRSEGSVPEYLNASQFWSVSASTEHPAEAALFLDFLANSEAAADSLMAERGIPANTKIRAYLAPQLSPAEKAQIEYLDALAVESSLAVPPPGGTVIHTILMKYTESVTFGVMTPEQAAEAFVNDLKVAVKNG